MQSAEEECGDWDKSREGRWIRNAGLRDEWRDLATRDLAPHSGFKLNSHLLFRIPHSSSGLCIGSKSHRSYLKTLHRVEISHSYLNSAADFETTWATPHPAGISTTIHARKILTFSAEAVGSVMCPLPMM